MAESPPIFEPHWELDGNRIQKMFAAIRAVEDEVEQERQRHQATQGQLDEKSRQNNVLSDILSGLEEQVPQLEATIQEKKYTIRDLRRELRKADKQAAENEAYLRPLEQSHQNLKEELARQRRQAASREKDLRLEVKGEKARAQATAHELELLFHHERQKTRRVTDLIKQNIRSQRAARDIFVLLFFSSHKRSSSLLHNRFLPEKKLPKLNLSHQHLSDSFQAFQNASSQSIPEDKLDSAYLSKVQKIQDRTQKRIAKMPDFDTVMTDACPLDYGSSTMQPVYATAHPDYFSPTMYPVDPVHHAGYSVDPPLYPVDHPVHHVDHPVYSVNQPFYSVIYPAYPAGDPDFSHDGDVIMGGCPFTMTMCPTLQEIETLPDTRYQTPDVEMLDYSQKGLTLAMTVDEDVEMQDVTDWESNGTPQHQDAAMDLAKVGPVLVHPFPLPPRKKKRGRAEFTTYDEVFIPPKRRKSTGDIPDYKSGLKKEEPGPTPSPTGPSPPSPKSSHTRLSNPLSTTSPTPLKKGVDIPLDSVIDERLDEARQNMEKLQETARRSSLPMNFRPKDRQVRLSQRRPQVPETVGQAQVQPQSPSPVEKPEKTVQEGPEGPEGPETKLTDNDVRLDQSHNKERKVERNTFTWGRIPGAFVAALLRLLRLSVSDLLLLCAVFVLLCLASERLAHEDWMSANDIPIEIAMELRNRQFMGEGWVESLVFELFERWDVDRTLMG